MKRITLLFFLYSLLALAIVALALDGIAFFDIYDQGKRLAGLLAMVFLAGQFLLNGRFSFIEQGLGHYTLMRYHRIFGSIGLILVLLHGTLDSMMRIQFFGGVSFEFPYDVPRLLGVVATFLLLFLAIPAIVHQSLKIPYQIWKTIHKISYFIFPLVLIHGLILGTTIRFQPLAMVLWLICAFLYVAAIVNRSILWAKTRNQPYVVSQVLQETHDTVSIYVTGPPKDHLPGQFAFVQLKQANKISQAHPFTLSNSPGTPDLRISVKAQGNFTRNRLLRIAPGDEMLIEGPYGWFSYIRFPTQFELCFVAGGIGITPFVSMLAFLSKHDPDRKVTLIWGNKTPEDIGFSHEIENWLTSMKNFRIIHVFSETPPLYQIPKVHDTKKSDTRVEYKTGSVTQELLDTQNSDWTKTGLMVCGPPGMMKQVQNYAKNLTIPSKHVLIEI